MRTKSGQIYKENLNLQSILRLFLSNYVILTHTRNAGTPYPVQHSTRKKSHVKAQTWSNDKRCTHLHIAISYNPMLQRTPRLRRATSNTLHEIFNSAQHSFPRSSTEKLSPSLGDTFLRCGVRSTCLPHSYKVEIACMPEHHVAPHFWAPSNILPYPTPQSRHPDGYLAWDLPNSGVALSPEGEPHSQIYKGLSILYICGNPQSSFFRKFGSRTYTTKTLHI